MVNRGILVGAASAFVLLALLSVQVQPVSAFDVDTHYYLTYYICRGCGFSEEQAQIVASADRSVDWGGTDTGFLILHNNQAWHGLSHPLFNDLRESYLWLRALEMADTQASAGSDAGLVAFGQFLHFLQDRHVHELYFLAPVWGHFYDGYKTDWLAFRPDASREMAEETFLYVSSFASVYGASSSADLRLNQVIGDLIAANPDYGFWASSSAESASLVIESYLGESVPPALTYFYNSWGEVVSRALYPEVPFFSYLRLFNEQLRQWPAAWVL